MSRPSSRLDLNQNPSGWAANGNDLAKSSMRANMLHALVIVCLFAFDVTIAWANNGMENVGYSAKSVGMGGTSIAVGDDTTVMNTNPAAITRIEHGRADMSLEMMFPGFSFRNPVNDTGGKHPIFLIPSAGVVLKRIGRWSFGIAMFNEGGTGTDYGVLHVDNALVGGSGTVGIEYYSQFGYMIATPTVAYQLTDSLSLGVSPQIGYAMMRMKMPFAMPGGFQAADMDGTDVNWRLKLGLLYSVKDDYGVGFAYTTPADINLSGDATLTNPATGAVARSKMQMRIGWPASFKAGAYLHLKRWGIPLRFAFDVERLEWSKYYDHIPVRMSALALAFTMPTGWKDQTVYKFGVEYRATPWLTLRGGYNHTANPVPVTGALAVMNPFVEDHLTVGFGYSGLKNFELNGALVIGLKNTVHVGASHPFAPDMQQSTTGMQYVSTLMQISYKW